MKNWTGTSGEQIVGTFQSVMCVRSTHVVEEKKGEKGKKTIIMIGNSPNRY